ncbi:hypothetical protein L484_004171 [Morus notabilis]|uniref:Uncharacterized protein n=1 Tax=Morus notabilis TaxID=981085 RepID=W9QWY5_9ROSA|nr:hypothetical protein L484_004171 [Morus notabilis]
MLLNYVKLDALLRQGVPSRAAEEVISALHAAQEELSSDLEAEKAKVRSLKGAIAKEKSESFQKGFNEGCSKAVGAYLASPVFQQKKREVVEEFLNIVEERVEQFKSSEAFEGLLTQRLDAYQDSAEFEELQISLIKYAREQILDRFQRKRPEVDLSFLDEFDDEEVEVVEAAPGDEAAP